MADSKNNQKVVSENKNVEIWFEKNWKKCLVALVLILVIGMTIFAVIYFKQQKETEATRALASAKVADLPALLEKNSSVPGAAAARIRLADDLLAKKDYAGAKAQFKIVADDASVAAELRSRAKLSAISCDESAGKTKEAAEAFVLLMNDNTTPQRVRDEAGFHAGRIFLSLNDPRGKEILQKIANTPADGSMANPWKKNAAALLKQAK